MLTDPIADLLTRIRNGLSSDHDEVRIPSSRLKADVARILKEQGYITDFAVEPARVGEVLRVKLKYTEDRRSVIEGIRRESTPGKRRYVSAGQIPRVQGGMGTSIVSTSHGVMTGHEATAKGVGGELVATVW